MEIVEDLRTTDRSSNTEFFNKAADTIETLRQRVKELENLLIKAKAMPMKYRRMEFNAQLQEENAKLRDELAALKQAQGKPVAYGDRLGTPQQAVYCNPSTGVPPWMAGMTPLYTSTPTIPEGWQLVPIEPTEEMLDHISGTKFEALLPSKKAAEIAAYSRMLSVAPKPKESK